MIILTKHVFIWVSYFFILGYTYNNDMVMFPFIIMSIIYYSIMLIPYVHKIYIYNLMERSIPKWTYLIRAAFHYLLFKNDIMSAFPSVLIVCILSILKDIIFLIEHAETRLAKIDKILYEDPDFNKKRISHLHLNVFADDINNRFHKHCFNTNRLYVECDITPYAADTALAINNYRILRKDKKRPREFTEGDEVAYIASENHKIFISGRDYFYVLPSALLMWMVTMLPKQGYQTVIIGVITSIDLFTIHFGNKINDIAIDLSYIGATFIAVYLEANP